MQITTKPCIMCGNTSVVEVDAAQYNKYLDGGYVQDIFPNWAADQRELLITGTHGDCWDIMFGDEE